MEEIILKQPRSGNEEFSPLLQKAMTANNGEFFEYLESINKPTYLFWDKAMYRNIPKDLTKEEAWLAARSFRKLSSSQSPITSQAGVKFTFQKLSHFDEILHHIDLQAGGKFLVNNHNIEERQKFLTRGIMEEAIASSQLEGASTTRKYAKEMIAENKKPRNKSEWMIYNNYKTMSAIDEEYKELPLSMDLLMEMHGKLTSNTLDLDEDVGNLRKKSDTIQVIYNNKVAYKAPSRKFVDQELPKLIAYANDNSEFVHPVIKASILHFWMGYLHPFADGNGRLARTLFYWYLLKNNYWAITYIPISMVLKRAKKQYTYAYIFSEQDQNDLTYFLDFKLRKLNQAIEEFDGYVKNLKLENELIDRKLSNVVRMNERQKQLLYFLLSNPGSSATELSHRTMNGIARNTARADLGKLLNEELLVNQKEGKTVRYYPSEKLYNLVNSKSKTKRKFKPSKEILKKEQLLQQSLFDRPWRKNK